MGLQAGGRGFESRTLHKSLQSRIFVVCADVIALQPQVRGSG